MTEEAADNVKRAREEVGAAADGDSAGESFVFWIFNMDSKDYSGGLLNVLRL
jgi:hypothetical protein